MRVPSWQVDLDEDCLALGRVACGDGLALEELYRRYAVQCLSHATAVLRDPHLAEEAVQEAFVDLWQHAAAFDRTRCSVGGWLRTLTHRRAVDRVRARERGRTVALEQDVQIADDTQDPVGPAITAVLSAEATAALWKLPVPQRRALVLAYWGGYTMTEISVLERVPLGTVKTRCRTALTRLRAEMSGAVPAEDNRQTTKKVQTASTL